MAANLWFPKAAREPGHPQAHGYSGHQEPGPKDGLVYHSAEGSIAVMRRIIRAPGEPSWTISNPKVGRPIQHYPRGTHIWANGSQGANVRFDACESEGMAGEPLNQNQTQNLIDLARWYKKEEGWHSFSRLITAWEHCEMTRFGAPPTACPSGRIPWDIIIPALEEDMTDTEVRTWLAVEALFLKAAGYAAVGEPLPKVLADQIHYLLHA